MNFFNLSPSPVETTSNSAASGNRRASIVVVFGLSLALIFGIPEHLQRGTNQVTNKSHTTNELRVSKENDIVQIMGEQNFLTDALNRVLAWNYLV